MRYNFDGCLFHKFLLLTKFITSWLYELEGCNGAICDGCNGSIWDRTALWLFCYCFSFFCSQQCLSHHNYTNWRPLHSEQMDGKSYTFERNKGISVIFCCNLLSVSGRINRIQKQMSCCNLLSVSGKINRIVKQRWSIRQ